MSNSTISEGESSLNSLSTKPGEGLIWVIRYKSKPPLVGLQAILEAHGEVGWELVSLDLERSEAVAGIGKWAIEPITYRVTFKRPKE